MPDVTRPRVALVLGDPAGIGPELVAKLLSDPAIRDYASALIVGDQEEMQVGMRIAGCNVPYRVVTDPEAIAAGAETPLLYDFRGGAKPPFEYRRSTANAGRYVLDTLTLALSLTQRGVVDALCYAPVNKAAMHMAGMPQHDELVWFAHQLGHEGPYGELNSLEDLWTSRVTSHVALKDVSGLLTAEKIATATELIYRNLIDADMKNPRIAVCGLNPHNGDNGAFGREEIEVIEPGIRMANARGIPAMGPFPADTVFLKAKNKEVDAVVTMYHDQGQIAMKLMGFSSGVSLGGGFAVTLTTPTHGTAFDIYGKGLANPGATIRAYRLACDIGLRRRGAMNHARGVPQPG